MKVAVTAPSDIALDLLTAHLPEDTCEIIPAGIWGAGESMLRYAKSRGIKVTELFVEYEEFGPMALLEHFMRAIDYADRVIIFRGSLPDIDSYIGQCELHRKPLTVVDIEKA